MPDTRDKRASAIGSRRLPWLRRFTLPLADGSLDQGDRQQVVQVYRGILAGAGDPSTLIGTWSNVIDCRSANKRIECVSANKRIEI